MKPAQTLAIVSMTVCDLAAFMLSVCFTGLTSAIGILWVGYSWDEMNSFVVPYVLAAAVACLLSIAAIVYKKGRTFLGWFAATANIALPLFCWYAFSRWPGGADGGMMSWAVFVMPITVITLWSSIVLGTKMMRTVPFNRHTAFWPWLIPYLALLVAAIGSTAWAAKILLRMFLG
jgi:hypothetical protein